MPPFTIGVALALIAVILAVLGLVNVLPAREQVIFGLILLLGLARLT